MTTDERRTESDRRSPRIDAPVLIRAATKNADASVRGALG